MKKLLVVLWMVTLYAEDNVWDDQFSNDRYAYAQVTSLEHHVTQNSTISDDFLKNMSSVKNVIFYDVLQKATAIVEIGCGTGEMLQLIGKRFTPLKMLGLDICDKAVEYAYTHNKNSTITYKQFDCLSHDIQATWGHFDVVICSNTLEHFKNPFILLDRMLEAASAVIILVPYNQTNLHDEYGSEGGIAHVYSFTEYSFDNYDVVGWFLFQTDGWQCAESSHQLAIMVRNKIA
jgi:SAM-dependent methyltransferase